MLSFSRKSLLSLGMLLVVGVVIGLSACESKPNPLMIVIAPPDNAGQSLTDIYDDNRSTVFLKVALDMGDEQDNAVAQVMLKKRLWEERNPNKKVVAMTIVSRGYSRPLIAGLLIHYEQR